MIRLAKILLAGVLFFLPAGAFAQDNGSYLKDVNVEEFPEVSFVYHCDNPVTLLERDFLKLTENGLQVDFDYKSAKSAVVKDKPMHIIILWENMRYAVNVKDATDNGQPQFDFTKGTLDKFFRNANIGTDNFAIYSFNRRGNSDKTLSTVVNFTNNVGQLQKGVSSLLFADKVRQDKGFENRTDYYTAVREAVEILQFIDGPKAVIVFTAGYPMNNSGSDSSEQVKNLALAKHVPIYNVQYSVRNGVTSSVEGFANASYGGSKQFSDNSAETNIDNAVQYLLGTYSQMKERWYGYDYELSYTSNTERGDEMVELVLNVSGSQYRANMTPPAFSIMLWAEENLVLAILCGVGALLVLVFIIWFIVKMLRGLSKRKRENRALASKMHRDKEEADKRIAELEDDKRKILEAEEQRVKDAEQERILKIMHTKSLRCNLVCQYNNQHFNYPISNKVETTIGREDDNDVVIPNMTVSRHHAKIVFTGTEFQVIDLGSSNKVIVNGVICKSKTLRNGDMIGLGEALITFYC